MIQDEPTKTRGWALKAFGDCADLIRDPVKPTEESPDVRYIGLEHIEEGTLQLNGHGFAKDVESNKFRFQRGDILFGKLRPYFRKVVIAPFDGICSTDIWVVRAKKGIDQRYLFYWMASQQFIDDTTRASEGTKMPRAKWDFVSRLVRYIPPLPEQRVIIRILGTLDDKIELNWKMNATLEAMAQAIFKSWFVDFDPVRVKMEGREPAGMDVETAARFPDEFEVVDGREVPMGWRYTPVEEICETIENGGTPKRMEPCYWDEGTIPWFKTGELLDAPLIQSEELITEAGLLNSSCKLWNPKTILIALYASPTVGRLGILEIEGAANQACSALVARKEYGYLFLYYSLLFSRERLQNVAVGAAQQNINQKVVKEHRILVPTLEIAQNFQSCTERLYVMKLCNLKQSRTLAALRDILLPKLISGEIPVPDAMLEAAEA